LCISFDQFEFLFWCHVKEELSGIYKRFCDF
jgi:hypothetical protein